MIVRFRDRHAVENDRQPRERRRIALLTGPPVFFAPRESALLNRREIGHVGEPFYDHARLHLSATFAPLFVQLLIAPGIPILFSVTARKPARNEGKRRRLVSL